jgi:hypothetical protein
MENGVAMPTGMSAPLRHQSKKPLLHFRCATAGKCIRPFIQLNAGVPFDFVKRHLMVVQQFEQTHP